MISSILSTNTHHQQALPLNTPLNLKELLGHFIKCRYHWKESKKIHKTLNQMKYQKIVQKTLQHNTNRGWIINDKDEFVIYIFVSIACTLTEGKKRSRNQNLSHYSDFMSKVSRKRWLNRAVSKNVNYYLLGLIINSQL